MSKEKKIWILNHYAAYMYLNKAGRHYWFSQNLINKGYKPIVFCASDIHNTDEYIEVKDLYREEISESIPFVFAKTPQYHGNGISRVINMITFFINMLRVSKKYIKENDGYITTDI